MESGFVAVMRSFVGDEKPGAGSNRHMATCRHPAVRSGIVVAQHISFTKLLQL
jgi:hypothetical protein